MTHTQRVLALLSDGKPHSYREGYRLGVMLHSRVADLRKRGYVIECDKSGGDFVYRLISSGGGADGAGEAGGRTPASAESSSSSAPPETFPQPPVAASPASYGEPPEPFPPQSVAPGQLTFEAA